MSSDIEDWFDRRQRAEEARRRACETKRWFDTEAEARAAALLDRTRYGEELEPYRCDICSGWHLTAGRRSGPRTSSRPRTRRAGRPAICR